MKQAYLEELLVVVSERHRLSAHHVEQDVSVAILHEAALAPQIVHEDNVGGSLLNSVYVSVDQVVLRPAATDLHTDVLSLRERFGALHGPERTSKNLNVAVQLTAEEIKHL